MGDKKITKQYWQKFYNKNPQLIKTPTSFARFCASYIPEKATVVDVGCGNGRDTYYFGKLSYQAIGVDFVTLPQAKDSVFFFRTDISDLVKIGIRADVIYSRFFIHAIPYKTIVSFLKWSKGIFMAEFRIAGDKPVLYPDHKRTLVDRREFLKLMVLHDFDILRYEVGRDFARYKNENPLVARIIAKK